MSERVLVAMSGGVDSSVAAARLTRAGLDVVGVTLHLWDTPDDGSVKGRCCAPEDVHDARRVADVLGIPHFAFDRRELFREQVVDPFVDAYLGGQTPSPCVQCNRSVKVHELLHLADRLGATRVASGHYARVRATPTGYHLLRGKDPRKDQSYFLHMLSSEDLSRLCFPLGEASKEEVRAEAAQLGLPGASKGESQELCFVPKGRYDQFVSEHSPERVRPGPIVDGRSQVVGQHRGIHGFTLGQRRNLGVSVGQRAYVVGIDRETATVRLGTREELLVTQAVLDQVSVAPDIRLPVDASVMVRYQGELRAATLSLESGAGALFFAEPALAVVPGQFAVFFLGDRVIGGGRIISTSRSPG